MSVHNYMNFYNHALLYVKAELKNLLLHFDSLIKFSDFDRFVFLLHQNTLKYMV